MGLTLNGEKIIEDAYHNKYGLLAFNVIDIDFLTGVLEAAEELNQSIFIQTSESLVKTYGLEIYKVFSPIIDKFQSQVILHLDHCSDINLIKNCIDNGWGSVMIDASHYPIEKNIQLTNLITDYIGDQPILCEAEIGPILGEEDGYSSSSYSLPNEKELEKFLNETQPTMLALGIGNKHGFYNEPPVLNFSYLELVNSIKKMPLVLHGGTGLSKGDVAKAIDLGVVKINISTALKHCYVETYKNDLNDKSLNILNVKKEVKQNVYRLSKDLFKKYVL